MESIRQTLFSLNLLSRLDAWDEETGYQRTCALYDSVVGCDSYDNSFYENNGFELITTDGVKERSIPTIVGSNPYETFKGEVFLSTGDSQHPWRSQVNFAGVDKVEITPADTPESIDEKMTERFIERAGEIDDLLRDPNYITIVETNSLSKFERHDVEVEEDPGYCTFDSGATIYLLNMTHARDYNEKGVIDRRILDYAAWFIDIRQKEHWEVGEEIIAPLKANGLYDYLHPSVNPDEPPAKIQKTQ